MCKLQCSSLTISDADFQQTAFENYFSIRQCKNKKCAYLKILKIAMKVYIGYFFTITTIKIASMLCTNTLYIYSIHIENILFKLAVFYIV